MVNSMNPDRQFLQNLYEAFNNREIETIISSMHPNVKWANGMEGGFIYRPDRVRDYWEKQFEIVQPKLQILNVETDEANRSVVTAHPLGMTRQL